MLSLHKSKRYSACLFFGHLILEKGLKINIIQETNDYPPRIHNLRRLADMSGIVFTAEELEFLAVVNTFNIEGRYPEDKYNFYERCDKKYVDSYLPQIKKLYQIICQKIK